MKGILLRTKAECAVPRPVSHVHFEHQHWKILSATPVSPSMLHKEILDMTLPGLLGAMLLPIDATFVTSEKEPMREYDLLYEREMKASARR